MTVLSGWSIRAFAFAVFAALFMMPISALADGVAPHLVVNTHRLNIRSGPGVGYNILISVPGGTELPVLGMHHRGLWYQIQGPAGVGWVNSHYTIGRGDFSRVRQAGGSPVVVPVGAPHLVVNTGRLNVRSGPGMSYRVITSVRGGTQLPVVSIASDNLWYEVDSVAGRGWVNSYYTVTRGNFSSLRRTNIPAPAPGLTGFTPRVVVNTHRLNIRSGPGRMFGIVTSVRGGTTLAVTAISPGRHWFKVEGSFGTGWLNNNFTVFRGDISRVPTVG